MIKFTTQLQKLFKHNLTKNKRLTQRYKVNNKKKS